MGGEGDVQIFSIYRFSIYDFNAERTSLVVRVTTDDNTLAVGTLESDGLESVFYRIEGKERAARLYEVGEMLVGVVLGSVPICSVGRAHLHDKRPKVELGYWKGVSGGCHVTQFYLLTN